MKRNGGTNANSSSIHNATKKGNTGPAGEQNASETAKKANPKAVLANEKKAATQLGVIVGMSKIQFLFPTFGSAYTYRSIQKQWGSTA